MEVCERINQTKILNLRGTKGEIKEVGKSLRLKCKGQKKVRMHMNMNLMQSYPPRALDRRLQEDWAKDARENLRVLMSLRIDFGPMG